MFCDSALNYGFSGFENTAFIGTEIPEFKPVFIRFRIAAWIIGDGEIIGKEMLLHIFHSCTVIFIAPSIGIFVLAIGAYGP